MYGAQGIPRQIAEVIAIVVTLGFVVYLAFNLRKARPEAGAEIELAPNRKQYFDDDVLEGPRLERFQMWGVAMLAIVAIGLPVYFIREPGRQAGATVGFDQRFASWGAALFAPTTEGGFGCASCHGGMGAPGGVAQTVVTDPLTGATKQVNWYAPALNTVLLRYSESSVKFILTYGRKFSPMSAWGTDGGGPMNDQQLNTLIAYLKSIQLCDPATKGVCAKAQTQVQQSIDDAKAQAAKDGKTFNLGEFLFSNTTNSGAYGCARCHTAGFSYGDPKVPGGGALGPSLISGSTIRQFPDESAHITFVNNGDVVGEKYGVQGQGEGRMPGFGKLLTADQIKAIVEYERGL
jgi:mono/diheme cytochrome c family protein